MIDLKCLITIVLCTLALVCLDAQEYCGTTGLLHIPTAETDSAGTFRGGAFFLNDHFTPEKLICDGEKYNTGGYYIGLTPWPWIEVSYACTLLKYHKNNDKSAPVGYYNEDRRLGVKLRPLKEGKWWPAVVVGADDVEQLAEKWLNHSGGTYFHNVYIAGSKHLYVNGNEVAAHLGYRYYFKEENRNRRGVMGGVAFRPCFYRDLRFMAEWDGAYVNLGADVLLWKHLFMQVGLTNGKYFFGGMSYHYTIRF